MQFYKYHGAGNDFILINNYLNESLNLSSSEIVKLCNRRFGIGADGLMILNNHNDFDFEMNYYNSDGSGGTMCGNGGRCIVAFAKKLGIINNHTKFIASDGLHEAFIDDNNTVKLKMSDVNDIKKFEKDYTCNTGSPHYIKFVDNIEDRNVFLEGKKIRYSPTYKKKGINVNFIKINDDNSLSIRTYERGVEDETFACGTGAVAAALTYAKVKNINEGAYIINAQGGLLKVSFKYENNMFTNIWLEGSAMYVFKGTIYAPYLL